MTLLKHNHISAHTFVSASNVHVLASLPFIF